MDRSQILKLLVQVKPILAERYGVTDLALFGSAVRGTAHHESDIDILVAFDGPAISRCYFGVLFYLEDLFNRPIDLVTDRALRTELRPTIEGEAIYV